MFGVSDSHCIFFNYSLYCIYIYYTVILNDSFGQVNYCILTHFNCSLICYY